MTDVLLVSLSFTVALEFNNLFNTVIAVDSSRSWQERVFADPNLGVVPVLAALISLLNYSEGLYSRIARSRQLVRGALAKSVVWAMLLTSALLLSSAGQPLRVRAVAAGGFIAYQALWTWRKWHWWRTARCQATGRAIRNILIVGAGPLGREVAYELSRDFEGDRTLVGYLDEDIPPGDEIKGRPEDLAAVARAYFVDEIILAIPNRSELAQRVVREAVRCRLDVRTVPESLGCQTRYHTVERLGRLPLLTLHEEPAAVLGPLLKRVFDIVSSSLALALAAPLLTIIAIAVKLDSPGPVLYLAPRAGKKGRTFPCFKFRTMMAEADVLKEALRERNERCGPFFKISDDPRITRLGRLLRCYSLDELPQLWNVLRGEMSLVGPRPHPLDDCQRYQLEHLRRLDVSPGITGLWQVTARQDCSFQRGLALDLHYIEHWSFWSDLQILCSTVGVVLKGSGK